MFDDAADETAYPEKTVLCCFCGTAVRNEEIDPCQLVVTTNSGQWQVWFCHARCFKSHLVSLPNAPDFFSPTHF